MTYWGFPDDCWLLGIDLQSPQASKMVLRCGQAAGGRLSVPMGLYKGSQMTADYNYCLVKSQFIAEVFNHPTPIYPCLFILSTSPAKPHTARICGQENHVLFIFNLSRRVVVDYYSSLTPRYLKLMILRWNPVLCLGFLTWRLLRSTISQFIFPLPGFIASMFSYCITQFFYLRW